MSKSAKQKYQSPYCPVCEACGEEGCCPPTTCKRSKDGYYCEGYLKDFKFGYLMYQELYDLVAKDKKYKKKIEKIFDKNYDKIYKPETNAKTKRR